MQKSLPHPVLTRVAGLALSLVTFSITTAPTATHAQQTPPPASAPAKKADRTSNRGPEKVELKFKLPPPPVRTPEEQLKTFKVEKGFRLQLVAANPMVESPVAMSWDHKGRLYVVEMRGYMNDLEGSTEDRKTGRIKLLEDLDGDGDMDKVTTFVDNLLMPRAVMALGDGALVGEPPNLTWYRDTDGDGVADKQESVSQGYGTAGGQPEHMANSPTWGLDNWITNAGHGTRFRFTKGKFVSEPTRSSGQWGLTQDDWGRRYFNYNSDLLRADLLPASVYARNPNLTDRLALNYQVMKTQQVWPSVPTPGVNRGYNEGQLRPDGRLASVTGTCGPCIYRGDLFASTYYGNAFIPEPCGNLVKRLKLSESGGVVSAANAYEGTEFITSSDERFRPVNAYNGPDGALYIVDMYRGIIQHKYFLTHYLVENIKARKLEQPVHMGRIWRIVPEQAKPKVVKLPDDTSAIVPLLAHANGHVRDTAQRVLVERGDTAVARAIETIAAEGATPQIRVQALWTLDGLKALTPEVLGARLKDESPKVRAAAVSLSNLALMSELLKMTADPSAEVRVQLAIQLSALPGPEAQKSVLGLLKAGGSPLLNDAIASGVRGRELEYLEALLAEAPGEGEDKLVTSGLLQMLSGCVMNERRGARIAKLLEVTAAQKPGSPRQSALLSGMAGIPLDKKVKPQKRKMLYLDAQPATLATMRTQTKLASVKKLLATVDESLAWPGKPGVPPPPVVVPLNAEQQARYEKGKLIYAGLCAACHQPSGLGMEGLAPPLVDSEWVTGPSDRPVRIILHGMSGPVQVSGRTWSLEMPPLPQFTDEDIAGVVTYIRREWEHTASPISPADVAKIRAQHQGRTKAWTAAELLKKPDGKKK